MKTSPLIIFTLCIINSFSQDVAINTKTQASLLLHKKEVTHNNYVLDNTLNLIDADRSPIYNGCENKSSNLERQNCLKTNLIVTTTKKLCKSTKLKDLNLKKGIHRIRLVMIIDEKGQITVKTIIGKYPKLFVETLTEILENSPRLIPAKLNNQNIPVKYSIRIPFIVK